MKREKEEEEKEKICDGIYFSINLFARKKKIENIRNQLREPIIYTKKNSALTHTDGRVSHRQHQ